jgi:hypothetical protein
MFLYPAIDRVRKYSYSVLRTAKLDMKMLSTRLGNPISV